MTCTTRTTAASEPSAISSTNGNRAIRSTIMKGVAASRGGSAPAQKLAEHGVLPAPSTATASRTRPRTRPRTPGRRPGTAPPARAWIADDGIEDRRRDVGDDEHQQARSRPGARPGRRAGQLSRTSNTRRRSVSDNSCGAHVSDARQSALHRLDSGSGVGADRPARLRHVRSACRRPCRRGPGNRRAPDRSR